MVLTHLQAGGIFVRILTGGATGQVLGGGIVKRLHELRGEIRSIREITRELLVSRNSVLSLRPR